MSRIILTTRPALLPIRPAFPMLASCEKLELKLALKFLPDLGDQILGDVAQVQNHGHGADEIEPEEEVEPVLRLAYKRADQLEQETQNRDHNEKVHIVVQRLRD